MIDSKKTYKYYLKADKIANHNGQLRFRAITPAYHYLKLLRKAEYYTNVHPFGVIGRLLGMYFHLRQYRYGRKYGWAIGINTVGPGIYLPHVGYVIINPHAKCGKNLTINAGCIIGAGKGGETNCPIIGDNVTIDPGCKIFNAITIADDIRIGANSVVNKSFDEKGITIAGCPAKKIGEAYRNKPINTATFKLETQMKL